MEETSFQYYIESRKHLEEARIREGGKLDNILLVVSGGAFSLSTIFFSGTERKFDDPHLLILAWIILVLSIVSQVISHRIADTRFIYMINMLDTWQENGFPKNGFTPPKKYQQLLRWTNNLAMFFLIVGIGLLTWFTSLNLKKLNNMPQDSQNINRIISPVGDEKAVDTSLRPPQNSTSTDEIVNPPEQNSKPNEINDQEKAPS